MVFPAAAAPHLRRWLTEQAALELAALQALWFPDAPLDSLSDHALDRFLQPAAVAQMLARLDSGARSALDRVLMAGGVVAAHVLEREFGELPDVRGYTQPRAYLLALARPLNALEQLFVRAILFPLGEKQARVYAVPPDVLALLPEAPPPGVLNLVATEAPPDMFVGDPSTLEDDLLVFVKLAEAGELEVLDHGGLNKASLVKLARQWGGQRARDVVSHEVHWPYVRFLRQLGLSAQFVRVDAEGRLRAQPAFTDWVALRPLDRTRRLLEAWLDSQWDELTALLRYQVSGQRPLKQARRAILGLVRQAPPGVWVSFEAFTGEVLRALPDFARPDGGAASWSVVDAYGRSLNGFAHWRAVDGEWLFHAVGGTLAWLGMVDLALQDSQPVCFRLNATGTALLAGEVAADDDPVVPVAVQKDGTIRIPPEAALELRWLLERVAERRDTEVYRLTQRSVQRVLDRGMTPPELLQALGRLIGDVFPPELEAALWTWVGQYGRVALQRAVLLTADDPAILEQIVRDARVRAPQFERLTESVWQVRESDAAGLAERLRKHGYGVQSDNFAAAPLSERDLVVVAAALEVYAQTTALLHGTSDVSDALRWRVQHLLGERQLGQALRVSAATMHVLKERLWANESTEPKP